MTNEEFRTLVRQYEKLVFTICYQMVRDYGEAQNLAQETFLSAYTHIDTCKRESLKPWLARIATNKAKDYLKSAYNRRVQLSADDAQADSIVSREGSPDDIYIASEQERAIHQEIYALKEPYLKVSVLYFIQGKNVDEIAEALRRPKKTVQTQIYRAKLQLQARLRKEA
nr:RNA polymerase sigma factor [Maliibacterium massiliense]